MVRSDLIKMFRYIVSESLKLKDKYTKNIHVKVEFGDIFSRDNDEYQEMIKVLDETGDKVIFSTPSGDIRKLSEPILTKAGVLCFVKIRKPDGTFPHRGDADFSTDYLDLKNRYQNKPHFELIVREKFEMLRLADPDFDIMTCFSNIPVRNWIK